MHASHTRRVALCSTCSAMLSRCYTRVPLTDRAADWSDDAFWDELKRHLPAAVAAKLITGPVAEKSVAPRRSFETERVRWGNFLLCGDAAGIVPSAGAKGLNLAA